MKKTGFVALSIIGILMNMASAVILDSDEILITYLVTGIVGSVISITIFENTLKYFEDDPNETHKVAAFFNMSSASAMMMNGIPGVIYAVFTTIRKKKRNEFENLRMQASIIITIASITISTVLGYISGMVEIPTEYIQAIPNMFALVATIIAAGLTEEERMKELKQVGVKAEIKANTPPKREIGESKAQTLGVNPQPPTFSDNQIVENQKKEMIRLYEANERLRAKVDELTKENNQLKKDVKELAEGIQLYEFTIKETRRDLLREILEQENEIEKLKIQIQNKKQ